MIYYYKIVDIVGNVISLLTCGVHLLESETQIEITKEEYDELYAALPQPEEPKYDDPNLIIDILTGEVE